MLVSLVLSSIISYVLIGLTFVYVLASATVLAEILTSYADKALNGVSGDVLGAGNELTQLVAVLTLVAFGTAS